MLQNNVMHVPIARHGQLYCTKLIREFAAHVPIISLLPCNKALTNTLSAAIGHDRNLITFVLTTTWY